MNAHHFSTPSTRWAALSTRNPLAASAFIYAVKTTRIYCRPTCTARLARRANVVFYASSAEARCAGFRACKRCKPDAERWHARDGQKEMIERACKAIDVKSASDGDVEDALSLSELASGAGKTRSHFHRVFRRMMGMTPRAYGDMMRNQRGLGVDVGLLDAKSGLNQTATSTSVFPFDEGCTISESDFTRSSSTDDIEYILQPWSSGFVVVAANANGICFLEAGDSEAELVESLHCRLPYAQIFLSKWSQSSTSQTTVNDRHRIFETIMEALVHPSGRMLDVYFDMPFPSLRV